MATLFVILCIITALFMIILLEIEIDIKYSRSLLVILHIGVLAIELKSRKKREKRRGRAKKKSQLCSGDDRSLTARKRQKGGRLTVAKVRKSAAYAKLIIKLIEGTQVRLNRISLPDVLPDDYRYAYIKSAACAAIISLFTEYLATKALTLTAGERAYESDEDTLVLDITLTARILHVIRSFFVMRKEIRAIKAEGEG